MHKKSTVYPMELTIVLMFLGVLGGAAAGAVAGYVVSSSITRDFVADIPSNTVTAQRVDELQGIVEALAATWRKESMRKVRAAATNAPETPQAASQGFSKDDLRREIGRRLAASKGVQ